MAEPTSALSFEDLILRVAREAGISFHGSSGAERAMIPADDEHDLDLCKTIVNDAIRMFISDAPPKGWRWMRRIMSVVLTATRVTGTADAGTNATHLIDATLIASYGTADDLKDWYAYILTGTGIGSYAKITAYDETTGDCTVADWLDAYGNSGGTDPTTGSTFAITPIETVGGDISRYPLAENFGGEVNGQIHYKENTNHSSLIEWRDEAYIRARRVVTVITGYPRFAATRPLEFYAGGTGPKRRWELILDRDPSAADTLEFPYTLHFDELRLVAGDASSVSGTTGLLDTALNNLYPDDYFVGWTIKIISGTGKNSYALVDDYTGGTAQFDVLDWLSISGAAGGTDPAASSVYVVTPPGNLHPAGLRFDEAIKAACLAQAEVDIEDIVANFVQKYNQKSLPKAYAIDTRSAPRKLGTMNRGERYINERTWADITTDNDI